ncbi:hypothetical protein BOTU111922_22770 [Bordetella tumulicola]
MSERPEPSRPAMDVNQARSIDFMHNQLADDSSIRLLNVANNYNRLG